MNTKLLVRFISVWSINSLLLYFANFFFPGYFVLGSAYISPLGAVVFSGFILTILCKIAKPLIVRFGLKDVTGRGKMFVFYWIVNSVSIWIIARMAPITGFGITAFYWAIALGFAANVAQWLGRQIFKAVGVI